MTAGLAGPTRIARRLQTVGDIESLSYFSIGLPFLQEGGNPTSANNLLWRPS